MSDSKKKKCMSMIATFGIIITIVILVIEGTHTYNKKLSTYFKKDQRSDTIRGVIASAGGTMFSTTATPLFLR